MKNSVQSECVFKSTRFPRLEFGEMVELGKLVEMVKLVELVELVELGEMGKNDIHES